MRRIPSTLMNTSKLRTRVKGAESGAPGHNEIKKTTHRKNFSSVFFNTFTRVRSSNNHKQSPALVVVKDSNYFDKMYDKSNNTRRYCAQLKKR